MSQNQQVTLPSLTLDHFSSPSAATSVYTTTYREGGIRL